MKIYSPIEKLLSKYFDDIQNMDNDLINHTDFNQEHSLFTIRKRINVKKSKNIRWFIAAACLFIVCGVSFYIINKSYNSSQENLLVEMTGIGEVKQIILSDGTKVWLNSKTELKYSKNFDTKNREVTLDGEAYFEVKRDESKPFIINSQSVKTTVLGTTFNVSAYKTDSDVKVSVISGKVAVEENKNKVLLTKNQQAIFDKEKRELTQNNTINASENVLWKEGKLLFKGISLEKVIAGIQRNHKTNIIISEKIKNCTISADFTDMSIEKIIKILEEIVNGNSSFKNNAYYLTGNGCS